MKTFYQSYSQRIQQLVKRAQLYHEVGDHEQERLCLEKAMEQLEKGLVAAKEGEQRTKYTVTRYITQ
jgi:exonuclease VII small subunit